MLKWTARAFALAAALQLGSVTAQDAGTNPGLAVPPAPDAPPGAEVDAEADVEAGDRNRGLPATARGQAESDVEAGTELRQKEDAGDAPRLQAPKLRRPSPEASVPNQADAQDPPRRHDRARLEAGVEPNDRNRPLDDGDRLDTRDEQNDLSVPQNRESFYRGEPGTTPPASADFQIDERIRAATQNLDIDDATRARYRWHNGTWWFKTDGGWMYYRDGDWREFEPDGFFAAPQAESRSDADGYYSGVNNRYQYSAPSIYHRQPYSAYRPVYPDRYDRGYYGYDRNYYGGRGYYDRGYYDRGAYGPGYGRPYGLTRDEFRGGVIGSQIGGAIGGRSGAALGAAIGIEAAD